MRTKDIYQPQKDVSEPTVESAKQMLIEKFGEGLKFTEDLNFNAGTGQVNAYRGDKFVGGATLGLDPYKNSSPYVGQNSGTNKWFITPANEK